MVPAMLSGAGLADVQALRARAVVVGASAGGIEALGVLLPALPARTPFPIIIVVHLPARPPSGLVDAFASRCSIAVREAAAKETARASTAWFAPPDYHLLVEADQTFSLSIDAPDHHSRPSIDALFVSAADVYGPALLGIVLTGASSDGANGAAAILEAGGVVVVQDPTTAEMPTMPVAAIARARPHAVGTLEDIAAVLRTSALARDP
jgi:two-component system, chemotaxis family, protein-glutamate methylesterase/glutaminase